MLDLYAGPDGPLLFAAMAARGRAAAADLSRTATSSRGARDLGPSVWHGGHAAPALITALVALGAYANALWGGFVYDDLDNVLRNPWIREPGGLWQAFTHHMAAFSPRYDTSYYRPLVHVIFAGVYRLAGVTPWAYHLTLVVLHAAASLAVYVLLARVVPRREEGRLARFPVAALMGALLFAVHPIHVEAVAWISGVVDLSCSLLVVLTLIALTSESSWQRLYLAPTLFFLALLGKEPAVMLIPVFLAFAAARGDLGDPARRRRLATAMLSLGVALAVYLGLRIAALGGFMGTGGSHRVQVGLGEGLLTASALLGKYAALLFLPYAQSAVYDVRIATGLGDPWVWLGVAAAAGAGVLAFRLRRSPGALLGIALLVLLLLPALYIPVLGEGLLADRYLYLPSVGLAILAAHAWSAWPDHEPRRRTWTRAVLALALVAASAVVTFARNRVWHDDLALWSDAVEKVPESPAAQENLGFALLTRGRPADAVTTLSRALELDPERVDARTNLASALAALKRYGDAIGQAQTVLRERPGSAEAHAILGYALAAEGRFGDAVPEYLRSIEIDPRVASVHNTLAIALANLGETGPAREHFLEAIRLDPANASYHANLRLLQDAASPGTSLGARPH